jgi:hypothetical protein
MRQRLELLSVVRIGDKSLQDALSKADLLQLAGALEQERFGAQVTAMCNYMHFESSEIYAITMQCSYRHH